MNIQVVKVRFDNPRRYKSRVYVWIKDENLLENLTKRRIRPVAAYRAICQQVPELKGAILTWSQKAGCSCGCSPGFIVDSAIDEGGQYVDLHITVTAEEVEKACA